MPKRAQYPVVNGHKICRSCGQNKSTDDYYWHAERNRKTPYPQADCKPCHSAARGRYKKLSKYNLTETELDVLLSSGTCQICGERVNQLYIDHDHQTGAVRGALCRTCNWMLGMAHDNIEVLARGIEYLARSSG